jgi:hypothetical protein
MKTKLLAGILLAGSCLMAAPGVVVGVGVAPPVYAAPYRYHRYWYGGPYAYARPYYRGGYRWGWGTHYRWRRW